jgi:glycosyltransferase involved in cell wall biosynthesis
MEFPSPSTVAVGEAGAPAAASAAVPVSTGLRICSVAYTFYRSDGRVRRYNEALAARGDRVDVIALRSEGEPVRTVTKGVSVTGIQKRAYRESSPLSYLVRIVLFFLRATVLLSWRQLRFGYDLVHVHSVPDLLVFTAWLPKLLGAKVILDIHDILPEFYASKFGVPPESLIFKLLLLVEKMSIAFSDHVISANDLWYKKLVERSVVAGKATSLLNFPDRAVFRPRGRTRNDGRFLMIYPGTLNRHQGLDIAITAFARIQDRIPKAEFHIYGRGPDLPALVDLVGRLSLGERVRFRGLLSLDEIARVMEQADLAVVPKRKDGFGDEAFSTKTLEFMALGVPVIVSDTSVDRYYFNNSVVRFFPAGDADGLAAAMLELAMDRAARESLIRAGTKFVETNCWDAKKSVYLDLVDSLTGTGTSGKAYVFKVARPSRCLQIFRRRKSK